MAATDPLLEIGVCDAGPIIHLDELASLDLLADFQELLIPPTVAREVEKHRPAALSKIRLRQFAPVGPASPHLEAITRAIGLHQGEKDALHIAQSHPGAMFLSDDAAARLAARNMGISSHGTLGFIIRAARRGHRTKAEVLGLLRSIPVQSTLYVRRTLLSDLISEVEKSIR